MATITDIGNHRCTQSLTVAATGRHRCTNSRVEATGCHRCTQNSTVSATGLHRCALISSSTLQHLQMDFDTADALATSVEGYNQTVSNDVAAGSSVVINIADTTGFTVAGTAVIWDGSDPATLESAVITAVDPGVSITVDTLDRAHASGAKADVKKNETPFFATSTPFSFRYGVEISIQTLSTGASKTITVNPKSLTINRQRNSPTTWNIEFADTYERLFSPKNSSSEYYSWIKPNIYTAPLTVNRVWWVKIQIGDDVWASPALVLVDVERSSTAESGCVTRFSGVDMSDILMQENQTLASKSSDISTLYTAQDLIAYVLDAYNVNYDLSRADDPPIRDMHFQGGTGIDWIKTILEVAKSDWYFEGNTFIAEQPKHKLEMFDWEYVDRFNIAEATYRHSVAGLVNEVDVVRTAGSPPEEVFEGEEVTRQSINLATPRYGPQLRIDPSTRFVTIENIDWMNANGEYYSAGAAGPFTTALFTPQKSVLNLTQSGSNATGTTYWKVRVSGWTAAQMNAAGLGFDDEYNVKVKDTPNQNSYGKKPAPNPISNMLIPDHDWAETHGRRYLDEEIRKLETMTFKTAVVNPWMRPGHTVKITEYGTNTSAETFFVESVSHSFSGDGMPGTNFTASKYQ